MSLLVGEPPRGAPRYKKAILFCCSLAIFLILLNNSSKDIPSVCKDNQTRPHFAIDEERINERFPLFNSSDILLINATIIDGDGSTHNQKNLLIQKGTIVNITDKSLHCSGDIIDLKGRFITPGLIDMHSHFGTRVQPQLKGTEDTNEYTSPITPYVRAIDGIDSQDPEISSLSAAGVTTHLVLTGSKNLISGESYAIKLHESPNNLVDELLVQYGEAMKPIRWLKMAFGENEKHTGLPGYPVSRIGAIWKIREALNKARNLVKRQDEWCSKPKTWATEKYPTDFELETLACLLRGDMNLNIHLYEAYDFESLIRVADEFNFKINSFHHALSSWKVTKLLKSHNSTVAIFSDEWGGKKEQYDGTVYAPKLLEQHDVPVAIKTDHPALPGQQLLYFAQIAHNYGLSAKATIASITSVPATSMGLSHRIGYVRKGYDADIVIWDRHPLELGTYPLEVIIDGEPTLNWKNIERPLRPSINRHQRQQKEPDFCPGAIGSQNIIVKGIKKSYFGDKTSDLTAVIRNGSLVCIDQTCTDQIDHINHYDVLHVHDGYLLPGVTSTAEGLGLIEMNLEPSTSDGDNKDGFVYAADGLKLDGLMIERLSRIGISQGIVAPMGKTFIKGYSCHFKLKADNISAAILNSKVALHFNIGHDSKSNDFPTISSQIGYIRVFLQKHQNETPIAIHTHNKAIIEQIIRLKNEFPSQTFIIVGGQEAYMIADQISRAKISIVLSPWRCTAKFWENRHCSPNMPLSESSIEILYKAGVQFSIAYDEATNLRRIFWEVGSAAKSIESTNFTFVETVNLITSVEEIFGIEQNKNLLIFEHNPFEFGANIALSVEDGRVERCYPNVEEILHGNLLF